jgi:hypothetical protein
MKKGFIKWESRLYSSARGGNLNTKKTNCTFSSKSDRLGLEFGSGRLYPGAGWALFDPTARANFFGGVIESAVI